MPRAKNYVEKRLFEIFKAFVQLLFVVPLSEEAVFFFQNNKVQKIEVKNEWKAAKKQLCCSSSNVITSAIAACRAKVCAVQTLSNFNAVIFLYPSQESGTERSWNEREENRQQYHQAHLIFFQWL